MKVWLNKFGHKSVDKGAQELPGETYVQFVTDAGDTYCITQSTNHAGIQIRCVRKSGQDQMIIYPKMSNTIEIL